MNLSSYNSIFAKPCRALGSFAKLCGALMSFCYFSEVWLPLGTSSNFNSHSSRDNYIWFFLSYTHTVVKAYLMKLLLSLGDWIIFSLDSCFFLFIRNKKSLTYRIIEPIFNRLNLRSSHKSSLLDTFFDKLCSGRREKERTRKKTTSEILLSILHSIRGFQRALKSGVSWFHGLNKKSTLQVSKSCFEVH